MFNFKKHSRFVAFILLVFVVIVGAGTGCRPQKQAGPPEKIIVAYTETAGSVLIHIAIAKGYFTEEGLDATLQPHALGKAALDSVIEGKADLATVADTATMFAIMGGKKITTIAVIATSSRNMAIVARKDRGISKPTDLNGKTIGVIRGSTSDYFVDAFLTVNGIDRKQVTIINLKPDGIAPALTTGKADAVSAGGIVLTQLQKDLGNKGRIFYGETFYTLAFCVTALQDFIKQHPEAVRKFLQALIRAESFVTQHPEESRRLVLKFVKAEAAVLDKIWDLYNYRVTLDQAFLFDIEHQTRWAMKNRLTKHRDMPNYLDFIYMDGLQAVKPEAVRIIQ